jgi:hypothetical protein
MGDRTQALPKMVHIWHGRIVHYDDPTHPGMRTCCGKGWVATYNESARDWPVCKKCAREVQ